MPTIKTIHTEIRKHCTKTNTRKVAELSYYGHLLQNLKSLITYKKFFKQLTIYEKMMGCTELLKTSFTLSA